jgi:transposase-like protein
MGIFVASKSLIMNLLTPLLAFKSLPDFCSHFKDEDTCRDYFAQLRWKGKKQCPYCQNYNVIELNLKGKRGTYRCTKTFCNASFSVKVGTIFQDSRLPLRKWFMAIYLISSSKKPISSAQLGRDIGVPQATAWKMAHFIRDSMQDPQMDVLLSGVVEVDETYIGGKNKNKHYHLRKKGTQGRSTLDKIAVFGMMEVGGRVRTFKVEDVGTLSLQSHIYDNIEEGSTIYSDEWKAYKGLSAGYTHEVVEHGRYQYVNGDCTTNRMENFWSHVKRAIIGVFHSISRKYTGRYLKEFDFRHNFNHKRSTTEERFNFLLNNIIDKKFSYKQLVA